MPWIVKWYKYCSLLSWATLSFCDFYATVLKSLVMIYSTIKRLNIIYTDLLGWADFIWIVNWRQSSHYSWNFWKTPGFLKFFSRALENSLKIQFWHQLLENSLNLSTNLSCRIKKYFFGPFFFCKYLVLKKIDVKFTTLGSWIFLFIHWEAPGKLLEFHNIPVVENPVEGQYCK